MTMPPRPLWRQIQAQASRLVSRRASGLRTLLPAAGEQIRHQGIAGRGDRTPGACEPDGRGAPRHEGEARADFGLDLTDAHRAWSMSHSPMCTMPGGRSMRHLEICGRSVPFTASTQDRARNCPAPRRRVWTARPSGRARDPEARRLEGPLPCRSRRPRGHRALRDRPHHLSPALLPAISGASRAARSPMRPWPTRSRTCSSTVEAAAARSSLPETPDRAAIDDLVALAYRQQDSWGAIDRMPADPLVPDAHLDTRRPGAGRHRARARCSLFCWCSSSVAVPGAFPRPTAITTFALSYTGIRPWLIFPSNLAG